MNEPISPELRAMRAGLDLIDKALFSNPAHKVTVMSPTAHAIHDDVFRSLGRIDVASKVLGWMNRNARTLTLAQMEELSVLIGLRKLERDEDEDYVRQDIEAREACHSRSKE